MRDKKKLKPRKVSPDPVFCSKLITKLTNRLMEDGKKQVAMKFLYRALDNLKSFIQEEYKKSLEEKGPAVSNEVPYGSNLNDNAVDNISEDSTVPMAAVSTKKNDGLESYKIIWFIETIIKKVAPSVEIISKRVGGANYSIPVPISANRALSLSLNWLINSIRGRKEHSLDLKIASEFTDIINGRGETLKKKEQTNKTAESNRAFSHYVNAR